MNSMTGRTLARVGQGQLIVEKTGRRMIDCCCMSCVRHWWHFGHRRLMKSGGKRRLGRMKANGRTVESIQRLLRVLTLKSAFDSCSWFPAHIESFLFNRLIHDKIFLSKFTLIWLKWKTWSWWTFESAFYILSVARKGWRHSHLRNEWRFHCRKMSRNDSNDWTAVDQNFLWSGQISCLCVSVHFSKSPARFDEHRTYDWWPPESSSSNPGPLRTRNYLLATGRWNHHPGSLSLCTRAQLPLQLLPPLIVVRACSCTYFFSFLRVKNWATFFGVVLLLWRPRTHEISISGKTFHLFFLFSFRWPQNPYGAIVWLIKFSFLVVCLPPLPTLSTVVRECVCCYWIFFSPIWKVLIILILRKF